MELVVENNYRHIAEIGVWKGELSRQFYAVADSLILVDPWKVANLQFPQYSCLMNEPLKTQEELDQILQKIVDDMPNAIVFPLTSLEAVLTIPDNSLDFVYIDAVHIFGYIYRDIVAWLPKVRPGGMIAGDDFNLTDVGNAVRELLDFQGVPEGKSGRTWFKKVE